MIKYNIIKLQYIVAVVYTTLHQNQTFYTTYTYIHFISEVISDVLYHYDIVHMTYDSL